MSVTARALATTTGDPALKLVLLTVAAAPGWPTAADVAAAAEIPGDLAADALAELHRRRLVIGHPATDTTRYGLPDDGWTYTRDDTDALPPPPAVLPQTITGAAFTGRRREVGATSGEVTR